MAPPGCNCGNSIVASWLQLLQLWIAVVAGGVAAPILPALCVQVEFETVVLNDGAAHAVDSSELAFKLASVQAFRNAYQVLPQTKFVHVQDI